jgi:SAM-dependent methyltransferase
MAVGFLPYAVSKLLRRPVAKRECVEYPLFTDPKDLFVRMDHVQAAGVARVRDKMERGEYRRVPNPCLCGGAGTDTLVARHDMHGIPLDVLLCSRCGLLRAAEVFDESATGAYYRYDYRDIHNGGSASAESYFDGQLERGESFLRFARDVLDDVGTVLEIGCGSGGVLYPFHRAGKRVTGFDYDDAYLAFGRSKGLDLHRVGLHELDDSYDLLVLSHVVEHFLRPREELGAWIERVADGKYLLIEVPGLFADEPRRKLYGYPVRFFQIAHVVQFFYRDFLTRWYESLGLEVLAGDETATFLLRKPIGWRATEARPLDVTGLAEYPRRVDDYVRESFFDYRYRPDVQKAKFLTADLLERIGALGLVRRIAGKVRA